MIAQMSVQFILALLLLDIFILHPSAGTGRQGELKIR